MERKWKERKTETGGCSNICPLLSSQKINQLPWTLPNVNGTNIAGKQHEKQTKGKTVIGVHFPNKHNCMCSFHVYF